MFRSDHFADISLSQWLAPTPPALVSAHLELGERFLHGLRKEKPVVVGPAEGAGEGDAPAEPP